MHLKTHNKSFELTFNRFLTALPLCLSPSRAARLNRWALLRQDQYPWSKGNVFVGRCDIGSTVLWKMTGRATVLDVGRHSVGLLRHMQNLKVRSHSRGQQARKMCGGTVRKLIWGWASAKPVAQLCVGTLKVQCTASRLAAWTVIPGLRSAPISS